MSEKNIIHRGQWEGQDMPNSFEVSKLYKTGVEADAMLLNDGKTLAVAHPADFGEKDQFFENMSPEDFSKMKVRKGEKQGGATPFLVSIWRSVMTVVSAPILKLKAARPKWQPR